MNLAALKEQDDRVNALGLNAMPRSMQLRALQLLACYLNLRITQINIDDEILTAFRKEQAER